MNHEAGARSERRRVLWLGCAALATITLAGAFAPRAAGANAAAVAAGVYACGSIGMAWLTSRATAFPRWAWFASSGVFALTLLVAAAWWPARAQVKDRTSTAWMLPWLYLVMALSPTPATGWCSARAPWSGPLFLGTSAMLSLILLGSWWLTH